MSQPWISKVIPNRNIRFIPAIPFWLVTIVIMWTGCLCLRFFILILHMLGLQAPDSWMMCSVQINLPSVWEPLLLEVNSNGDDSDEMPLWEIQKQLGDSTTEQEALEFRAMFFGMYNEFPTYQDLNNSSSDWEEAVDLFNEFKQAFPNNEN